MSVDNLVVVLQVAIGPVILISGVGLLLLSMTNRFARVTDRCRLTCDALREGGEESRGRLLAQLELFQRRAKLIRVAILLAGSSVLLAALLVIALFAEALFVFEAPMLIVILFFACLVCLIASLVVFLRDINVSLSALKLEVEDVTR